MTDYWNDPPDEPEVPECCNKEMDVLHDGTCVCRVCKHRIELQPDPEPTFELTFELTSELTFEPTSEPVLEDCVPVAVACPHGNLGPCDKCDHLADLAFDAAREQRLCRR